LEELGIQYDASSMHIKEILNDFNSSNFSRTNLSGVIYNIFNILDLIAAYISFFCEAVVNEVIAAAFRQVGRDVIFWVMLGSSGDITMVIPSNNKEGNS
jgi:hypothetical protein